MTWRRVLVYMAVFTAMYAALTQVWNSGLSRIVIDEATVRPAAWLARIASGDASIVAAGSHIRSDRASINVLYGCEGTDVLMLLLAALLVTPIAWRARLLGLLAGTLFVFAVNQARVLALFFALRSHPAWFGPLHGLVAPLFVVAAVAAFFLAWLRLSATSGSNDTAVS